MSTRKTHTEREAMREASSKEEKKNQTKRKHSFKIRAFPLAPTRTKKLWLNLLSRSSPYCTLPVVVTMKQKGCSIWAKQRKMMNPVSPKVHPLPPKKARNSPSRN